MTTQPNTIPVFQHEWDALMRERDELRLEVERMLVQYRELRAEVADLLPRMDADAMTISNLARENKELRASLSIAQDAYAAENDEVARLRARAIELEAALDRVKPLGL